MRKNDAGLKVYETGDVVTVGTGKVEYDVLINFSNGTTTIKSKNTGRKSTVETGRLNLVTDIREVYSGMAELDAPEEEPMEESTSYQKAVLFALNKLQKHVYAGTVSKVKKAKTRKLNRRQKASRKANR